MKDEKKTKAQLVADIAALRQEIVDLKASAKQRRRAEKKPQKNEGRLRIITDTIQDAVIMIDGHGKFSFWNPAAEKIFGYTKQEAVGKGFLCIFPKEKWKFYQEAFFAFLNSERQYDFGETREYECIRKDSERFSIEILDKVVEIEGQRHIVGVARDITKRKLTEKALRESEERLDLAVTGANLGLWDWNIQTESDVFNRQWAEMFGYTLEEIEPTAHSWERLVHPDDMPHVMDAWNAHVEGRTPLYEAEYRMRCKTGDWKWILDSGKIVEWDEDGNPLRATGVNRDITDRKLAQEALAKHKEHLQEMVEARTGELAKANERLQQEIIEREQVEKALRVSEQRFRELADLLPQIVFEADLDGRIAFMNRSGYEMFGYRDESLQKLPSYLQLLVPEDRNRVKENLQQFLGGEKSGINEYTALRKDGSTFPTLSYSSVVFRDGIPVGVRGIGVDITERKQAETVLRETQQRFLELVNLLPQTVFETDLEGNFTFVNRFGFEFYGYAQEDVDKGVHAFQVIVPEDRERAQHNIRRILTGEPPAGNEYRSLRKDGTVLSVVIYSSPIIREGKPAGLRGVVIDITERKRAEQELLESKGMLSALLNATEDAVFLTDNKGDILIHNDNFARRFGKSSDKLVGRNCLNIIPPELAKKRKEIADEMLTSGKALDFEDERDGRILHMSCYPICDKQGHVEKIAVFSRDITERTHAKQELQESRDMLSALLNATDDAVFLADTEERLLALNEKFASRFGKRVDELIGTNVFDLLPPDLAKARRKMVDKINATGKALNFVDERDGRIFHTFCYPICNKQGQVEKSAIFSRDITEQRQAEKALKESEERFRAIFDNAMDGIILADPETKQFYTANRMTCKMLGYSLEEIKTLGIRDIHPKEALPDVLEIFKKQLHGELTLGKDMPMKRKDSSVYYTDINASPIVVGGKTYLMGIFRDITERKEAEQELKKFKTISDKAGYGSAITDLEGNLVYINESFARMHGYSSHELIGKNLSVFHNDEQMKEVVKLNKRLLEEGSYIAEEVWHTKRDGTVFPTLMTAALMKDDRGRPLFLTATVIDITERRQAQERLHQLERERAEIEKLAATGRMAARVAHEINNPLAGIKNSFQLIKGSVPREHKYFDYVGLIDREIDRITRIVREMIDLHRPIEISPRKFRIGDTIREVAELLASGLREHEVSIQMQGVHSESMVTMHEDYLRQILYNILKNAIEASPKEGVVNVTVTKEDRALTITISDQGSGISEKETSRIFEPFFTTKNKRESGGLGLGLAISRGLVDVMGGSLDFDSSVEQGTTFRIVLPIDIKRKETSHE